MSMSEEPTRPAGPPPDPAGAPANGAPPDSLPTDVPAGAPTDGAPPGRRRRRWPVVLAVVAVLLIVLVVVASRVQLDYYVLTPGSAQAVAPLVTVPANLSHPVPNSPLLTDVYVSRVTLLDYVPYELNGNASVVSSQDLLGPYTPPDQLTTQGYLEMAQSQAAAKAAALTRLGYRVTEKDAGTLVFGVQPGTPAAPVLTVGQTITAANGTPTPNVCAFESVLHPLPPGSVVHLSVEHTTVTTQAVIKPGPVTQESVRLSRPPSSLTFPTDTGCPGITGKPKGYLGVTVETQQDFTYPFPVSVNTQEIGGPSAGLAMTLGIMDKLTSGHLTGTRRVAATGTIDALGNVGDVGGVAQKTVAVERAGATVFLVPPQEYRAAMSKDIPSLHVYAVRSLNQALAILSGLGGSVPPASQAAPPPVAAP